MRHVLIDYHPDIMPSRQPIRPRQPTIRAQRQASGEFKNRDQWVDIIEAGSQADEASVGG